MENKYPVGSLVKVIAVPGERVPRQDPYIIGKVLEVEHWHRVADGANWGPTWSWKRITDADAVYDSSSFIRTTWTIEAIYDPFEWWVEWHNGTTMVHNIKVIDNPDKLTDISPLEMIQCRRANTKSGK